MKPAVAPSNNCPCCHNRTLGKRGAYEICPVCFWEDDGQDDPDAGIVRGGPNRDLSLTVAQENFARIGVADPKDLVHVRPPNEVEATRQRVSDFDDLSVVGCPLRDHQKEP